MGFNLVKGDGKSMNLTILFPALLPPLPLFLLLRVCRSHPYFAFPYFFIDGPTDIATRIIAWSILFN